MEEREKPKRFKVGDLVTVIDLLELAFKDQIIFEGDVGIIIEIAEGDDLFGYDYLAYFNGLELVFFEDELMEFSLVGI